MRRVKTKWLINLSVNSIPKVVVGEAVVCGQVLVEEVVRSEKIFGFKSDIRGLENELVGKKIEEGKIIGQTKGFFPKKIVAPGTGIVSRIDEFNNLYLNIGSDEKRLTVSPVEAKVVTINSDSMELEFRADEFLGEGLNDDRAWGTSGLKFVENLTNLTSADENKVVVADHATSEILAKAEVVGVKGLVVKNDGVVSNRLPMLKLGDEEWESLLPLSETTRKVLLNAGSGRLLLVI